jgi:FkbM family methyltransferase
MGMPLKQRALRAIARQHWLRGRDRVIRAFSNPEVQDPSSFEADFFGHAYSGDMANFIDWNVFYYGAYALHELHLLAALAKALRAEGRPVHFFDVGANIGHHSLFMSGHAEHVFSFEPFAPVFGEMQRKLSYAKAGNVTAFPIALGDYDGAGVFYPPTGCNLGTGTMGGILPGNAAAEPIGIQVVRGDDFFAAHHLPPVSLIKIDVEGYEANVLKGLQETLRRDRPPILVEVQHANSGNRVESLLYPDHLAFAVRPWRGRYSLKPLAMGNTDATLILPRERAGILPETRESG